MPREAAVATALEQVANAMLKIAATLTHADLDTDIVAALTLSLAQMAVRLDLIASAVIAKEPRR